MIYKTRSEFHHDNEFILATIKRRFVAYIIDTIIIASIYYCINILLGLVDMNIVKLNVNGIFDIELEMRNTSSSGLLTFFKILFGLIPVLYFAISFYFFKGQTIGKYFLRLRVLSLYHEHIGLWHCIERSLGYYASALEFGFGFFQAIWNPNRMALHDKIGETIVVELPAKKRK